MQELLNAPCRGSTPVPGRLLADPHQPDGIVPWWPLFWFTVPLPARLAIARYRGSGYGKAVFWAWCWVPSAG